jgi:hypothetical protein
LTQVLRWPFRIGSPTLGAVAKGPQKRDVRLTLRLPEELAAQVQEAADADRRSKSDWIVILLEDYFAKRARRKQ